MTTRVSHEICQGEGGEQGDPLMPALYALGQHAALSQVSATLREGEMIFAYLDDIYVLCDPDRAAEIFLQVQHAIFHQAGIQVNIGQTKVWNGAAVKPTNMHIIGAEVRKGEGLEEKRGLMVLGVPVGQNAFVQKWLADKEGPICNCSPESQRCRTHRARGCSSWCVLDQGEPHSPQLTPSEVSDFGQNHDNHLRASSPCQCPMVSRQRWCSCLSRKEGWAFGVWPDSRQRPGQIACHRSMHVHHRSAHSFSTSWKGRRQEHSVFGKPNTLPQCLQQKARRCQSGPNSRTLPSTRHSQSILRWESGFMVGICCSRHPLCNLRAFATFVQGPPSLAGITTWAMRFEAFHRPPHQIGDHFHGRRVPHVAPRPFALAPLRG